jgi:tetratricopeptide (TPR) repeat protein
MSIFGRLFEKRTTTKEAVSAAGVKEHKEELTSPGELHRRGYDHHKKEEYDKAIQLYQRALSLDPSLDLTRQFLGEAYYAQGKLDEAIAVWKDALTRGITRPGGQSVTNDLLHRAIGLRNERSKQITDYDHAIRSYIDQIGQASQDWDIAYDALKRMGAPAVDALVAEIESHNELLRARAVDLLAAIGDKRALEPLEKAATISEREFCRLLGFPNSVKTITKDHLGMKLTLSVAQLLDSYRKRCKDAIQAIRQRT